MIRLTDSLNMIIAVDWDVKPQTGLQIIVCIGELFLYFSSKTYVVGTQKNHLNETVLLSTHNTWLN